MTAVRTLAQCVKSNTLSIALLLAAFVLASTFIPAPSAFAAENADDVGFQVGTSSLLQSDAHDAEGYQGGSIPILQLTFPEGVDPETGETISGAQQIALMNESANHEYKATGVTANLIVPPDYDNPESDLWDGVSGYVGETDLSLEFIRGRGNSTWRAAKKPYKFKLDEKVDLFGMGKNKHWVLLANYYDTSLSIDRFMGWLGDQMDMPYTPRGVPVDLFMRDANDDSYQYYGSYLLMEEVRVDKNRVEIEEVDENASDLTSLDITGDYLLGTNRKPTALPYEYFLTSRGTAFSWDTPEYESSLTEAQEAQQEYLKAHLERVEDAVFAKDFVSERGDYVWDLIDENSFADMWLIQEFTCNPDAYATPSTYLYKLRDQVADDGTVEVGKLYWGPLWDFDFVWGQIAVEGFDNTEAKWASLLRQDPEFVELLKERWEVLDAKLDAMTREGGLLDGYIREMSQSWEADHERWPKEDQHGWPDGSYQETIEKLRSCIEARRAWINANLDQLQTTYHIISFMDGADEVLSMTVREGNPAYYDAPEAADKEDMLFEGWFTKNHEEFDPYTPVMSDAVYYAEYVDASSVVAATDIFFAQSEVWGRYGANLIYDLMPVDARDTRIVWTSSDESVATVDKNGYVRFTEGCLDGADTAEAVITAHLVGSGKEASVRVVAYDPGRITLPEPDSITFDDAVEVSVGGYRQLRPTIEPAPNKVNEYFDLFFEVEDDSIATVTRAGVVVGKAPGTTHVTVTRPNPETYVSEVIATIEVTVAEGSPDDGGDNPDDKPLPPDGGGDNPDDKPLPPGDDGEEFTIVYELNGGTVNGSGEDIRIQCKAGEVITILDAPVRDGYTFLYWKGSEYHPGDRYTVTENHTFTAQWKRNESAVATAATPKTGDDILPTGVLIALAVTSACVGAYARMRTRSL